MHVYFLSLSLSYLQFLSFLATQPLASATPPWRCASTPRASKMCWSLLRCTNSASTRHPPLPSLAHPRLALTPPTSPSAAQPPCMASPRCTRSCWGTITTQSLMSTTDRCATPASSRTIRCLCVQGHACMTCSQTLFCAYTHGVLCIHAWCLVHTHMLHDNDAVGISSTCS